ncbi:MAG: hypothetical protein IPK83_16425 [Planctomycetes bacterium]|nr:hypothetical protein [Planctomycetota bacterium]
MSRVHGVSYIDERLAMVNCYETTGTTDDRPYYYVLDRMYNVRMLVDRAGAIVERYCYDPYGKPLIRESGGRGDMQDFGWLTIADNVRYNASLNATIWDPRADMDDDGDVDSSDTTLYNAAVSAWSGNPTVAQAFSDVGNPYMFQGVPHFAIDTSSSATTVKFPLNHHRARFAEPITGRWVTRDPRVYNIPIMSRGHGAGGYHFRPYQAGYTAMTLAPLVKGHNGYYDFPNEQLIRNYAHTYELLLCNPISLTDYSGLVEDFEFPPEDACCCNTCKATIVYEDIMICGLCAGGNGMRQCTVISSSADGEDSLGLPGNVINIQCELTQEGPNNSRRNCKGIIQCLCSTPASGPVGGYDYITITECSCGIIYDTWEGPI